MTTMTKKDLKTRRHERIRAKVKGTALRPRLAVFKSNRYLSVQLIDDEKRMTLAQLHGKTITGPLANQAEKIGTGIAEKAKALKITSVVFDRGGFRYAGQIKALADAARNAGLTF